MSKGQAVIITLYGSNENLKLDARSVVLVLKMGCLRQLLVNVSSLLKGGRGE